MCQCPLPGLLLPSGVELEAFPNATFVNMVLDTGPMLLYSSVNTISIVALPEACGSGPYQQDKEGHLWTPAVNQLSTDW